MYGNKIDLVEKREVSTQRAEEFADAEYVVSGNVSQSVRQCGEAFFDLACELICKAKQNALINNEASPMPREGKTISFLNCCSFSKLFARATISPY
ncbi:hypothetical protein COCON_G00075940 [Conger conger]|uniref:Uncharacterized protein n=1 Tax=Conger conger TaxID=82655 RepID=A0A9Q1I223_CONCO|nr:hypothetical protein COCON_G00075940 [Conger conger]